MVLEGEPLILSAEEIRELATGLKDAQGRGAEAGSAYRVACGPYYQRVIATLNSLLDAQEGRFENWWAEIGRYQERLQQSEARYYALVERLAKIVEDT